MLGCVFPSADELINETLLQVFGRLPSTIGVSRKVEDDVLDVRLILGTEIFGLVVAFLPARIDVAHKAVGSVGPKCLHQ